MSTHNANYLYTDTLGPAIAGCAVRDETHRTREQQRTLGEPPAAGKPPCPTLPRRTQPSARSHPPCPSPSPIAGLDAHGTGPSVPATRDRGHIHRVGRTARAGKVEKRLMIVLPSELGFLRYLKEAKVPLNEFSFPPEKVANVQTHAAQTEYLPGDANGVSACVCVMRPRAY